MALNGCEVSFGGDENVLKLDSEGCTPTNTPKPTKLYIFTGCIHVGWCEFHLNKADILKKKIQLF